jgi:hypothetical protein
MPSRNASLPTVAQLAALDAAALRALWELLFKSAPPNIARKEFYVRILAYEIQCRTNGSLSKGRSKTLQTFEAASSTIRAPTNDADLEVGTRLVREWGGMTHEVTIMDRGYAYRGRSYASLSEIARSITGARWSGPRFFGLRSLSKPQVPEKAG